MLLPERDCGKCTVGNKKAWGCTEDAVKMKYFRGEPLKRCPRRPILEEPKLYQEVYWLYNQYKQGNWPEEGGVLSQPSKLMVMFRVMDSVVAECQEELKNKPIPPAPRGPAIGRRR